MANVPGMMSFVVIVDLPEKLEEVIMFWPGVWETEIGFLMAPSGQQKALKCIVDSSRFSLKKFVELLQATSHSETTEVMLKERQTELWWQHHVGQAVVIRPFQGFTRGTENMQKRQRLGVGHEA